MVARKKRQISADTSLPSLAASQCLRSERLAPLEANLTEEHSEMNTNWNVFATVKRIGSPLDLKTPPAFGPRASRGGTSTRFLLLFAAAIVTLPISVQARQGDESQTPAAATSSAPSIFKDYIYGYAPVAMAATRAIQTAVPDNSKQGQAPINQFDYQRALSTPSDRLVIRPNADTLYTTAWLDLGSEPIVLHVPDTAGRYYLIPMLDAYSNQFAAVGSRTTGTREGNYAIVGPRWRGSVPESVNGVIHAPTNTVWMIGRTLVNGESDLQDAVAVTSQYNLIPLSSYPQFLRSGRYTPPTGVPVTPPNPDLVAFPVTSSLGFSKPEFFDVLVKYALENAPAQQFLQAWVLALDGFLHQNQLTSDVISEANSAMNNELQATAKDENGWSFHPNIGNYGAEYLLRAAVAKFGFGTNVPEEAVYMSTDKDITGASLSGTTSYVIHFAPGQTPPEKGFWSVTVYGRDGFFVENAIRRYDVGSQTGLVTNPDGSLDIFLQASEPQTMQSNWLPVPAAPFNLTLRIFWPEQSVLDGTWTPPTLSSTNAPRP
jgi:hypothetical protein